MKYGILFSVLSGLLTVAAAMHKGWYLWLSWPALSLAIVAFGYLQLGPAVYAKSADGLLSPPRQLILLPYLLYLWSIWHVVRLLRRQPAYHQLTDTIFIGRRLLSNELPATIDHVIDLTCEFNEPRKLRATSYHSFQILDGSAPSRDELIRWTRQTATLPGIVYIHCAEGHGRTGMFAAALLVKTGHSKTAKDALRHVQSIRPQVRLGHAQLAVLHAMESDDQSESTHVMTDRR